MDSLQVGLVPIGTLGGVLGPTNPVYAQLFFAAGGELAALVWILAVGDPEPQNIKCWPQN